MIKKDYRTVTSSNIEEFLEKINSYSYMAYDVETTGLNVRKEKVIGFSLCGEAGLAYYYPLYFWNGSDLMPIPFNVDNKYRVFDILKSKELLTWNGSFDLRITKNDLGVDLISNLMADGMLLKHTINEDGPFGLKVTGIELQDKIGLNVEEDANIEQIELKENIKKNGGSTTKTNYEMYKADLSVLAKYGAADADLTFRICEYYNGVLEKEGLQKFFYDDEVMPLYKEVTIPMEELGVKLDLGLINSQNEEIQKDIAILESKITAALLTSSSVQTWLYDQIEGYCETGKGKFMQKYAAVYHPDTARSEKTGKYLCSKLEIHDNSPENVHHIKTLIFHEENPSPINIFSKKQMGEIVFDYLGYDPISETEKGSPQFNDEMIESLVQDSLGWAKDLQDYNKLIKIKGSYIDRFLEGQEQGKYYFSYKQHGTISGRYGSDAQQLPRPQEDGSPVVLKYLNNIRKFFIVDDRRLFIDCDYESLEPHTFAHVSGDEKLRDIFRNNSDFYSTVAIDTEGLSQYSAVKTAPNYLGKLDKQKRQLAKVYALGIPYGMGGYALGKNLNIPTAEAEGLVEGYLAAYPRLKAWMDASKAKAQKEGYVKSELGRVRHLPKVKQIYNQFGDKLLDFKFRNKLGTRLPKDYVFSLYMDYKNGVNNARNFQIQSMAASIVNRAAIEINREFKKRGITGKVCAQIHDQLIFDIPDNKADECKSIVQDIMENSIKLSVKLKAPPVLAKNWLEGH